MDDFSSVAPPRTTSKLTPADEVDDDACPVCFVDLTPDTTLTTSLRSQILRAVLDRGIVALESMSNMPLAAASV